MPARVHPCPKCPCPACPPGRRISCDTAREGHGVRLEGPLGGPLLSCCQALISSQSRHDPDCNRVVSYWNGEGGGLSNAIKGLCTRRGLPESLNPAPLLSTFWPVARPAEGGHRADAAGLSMPAGLDSAVCYSLEVQTRCLRTSGWT